MSRVGKKPIPVPNGVTINVTADHVDVEGPKGKLQQALPPGVRFELSDGRLQALVLRENDRTLGSSMVWREAWWRTPCTACPRGSRRNSIL